uniref:SUN domain-containing protein n=1 Tax=Parastrongyloides trichosuri TaxID=131310 RepID=A0A0N4ZG19_PARTI
MIGVMIHYYHSNNDRNHLEKHKESIKSKILTDDMLTSGKTMKEKKRTSLLDTFFICLKKIILFVCPFLQTMGSSDNNSSTAVRMERKDRDMMLVTQNFSNTTIFNDTKTTYTTTAIVEEKMGKLKNELIEIFKNETKKIIGEELKIIKNIIDEKVRMIENEKREMEKYIINNIAEMNSKKEKEKSVVSIDYSVVSDLIEKAIEKYDSDKTEMVDYALESVGGRILEASSDKSIFDDWDSIVEYPFIFIKPSPNIVIQRTSTSLVPGNAWCFKGDSGYITIGLSYEIYISGITYEHIRLKNSPSNDLMSAPKHIEVYGINSTDHTCDCLHSLGNFTFQKDGPSIQTFMVTKNNEKTYPIVKIKIKSNYGFPYTCLYRIRVHGKLKV